MGKKLADVIFEELAKSHGITKMTKVVAVTIGLGIVGAGTGYLVSMSVIPDNKNEKEND